jgi:hypothetical protein
MENKSFFSEYRTGTFMAIGFCIGVGVVIYLHNKKTAQPKGHVGADGKTDNEYSNAISNYQPSIIEMAQPQKPQKHSISNGQISVIESAKQQSQKKHISTNKIQKHGKRK